MLICRFAPSPNGFLHLGHAYSALMNARLARAHGGLFLLRIEDIDRERSKPQFEQAAREDLQWLGLDWPRPERRQSGFFGAYRALLDGLLARGLAYPCFCTRGAIAAKAAGARDPDGAPLYPGSCRDMTPDVRAQKIAAGEKFAVRLDMARALAEIERPLTYREFFEGDTPQVMTARAALWGDAVIGRRDVPASYHLACVHDDAAQGVTDVVRGADLEAATGLHVLLQALLGLPTPDYRHHRLVLDEDGKKLAKSKGSKTLHALREGGVTAADARAMLGERMGTQF
ncbi:tRNA glutamyl-Q(34) synthetase GluQRS [Rhodoblastus acidophilus]|uniref:tRNA glutamyl-Q(34) synthetase GluQRS n=1 Tax=Rhodoblastus acidophilus TaxID=1074 RepID=A0A6N8DNT5_RHOAC|nr:tRNA glutamyl-Q(34) synthetase GluQRS [Rhodoblastus acidophilus]MCW2274910.1 glutamyl-Q tRNA(Asp) synthetase [Rhodoblastus acidophilus]MTV31506.1 tRNA glutamyl-Q(34) synthetase GluQRS [Rhodoblastus acidophilus]